MMKKFFLPTIIVIILAISGYAYFFNNNNKPVLLVNDKKINLEIANTEATREKGLSGRSSLPAKTGMLFIFPFDIPESFWNQEMKFPLDVVWIDKNQVVGVGELPIDKGDNVTINSPTSVNLVLELPAGQAQKNDLKVGTKVNFKNIPNGQ